MKTIDNDFSIIKLLLLVLVLTCLLAAVKLVNAQQTIIPGSGIADTKSPTCTREDCTSQAQLPLTSPGWKSDYNVRSGKKPRWYAHTANRMIKRNMIASALANAAFGLKSAKRAKTIKKFKAILTQTRYDHVYTTHQTLERALEDSVKHYISIASVGYLHELIWSYKRLLLVNSLIDSVGDHELIETKPVDMSTIKGLEERLKHFRELAAIDYFTAGSYWLSSGKSKNDYKRAAIYFRICKYYNREHPEVDTKYERARKLATTHIVITPAEGRNSTYTLGYSLDEDVRAHMLSDKRYLRYQFVDIVSKGRSDYTVRLVMDNFSLTKSGQTSDTKEFSKDVETGKHADGNPIMLTKKAAVTTYTKGIAISVKLNMEVINNTTKTVVHAAAFPTRFLWETIWQTSSGDLSVVKSKYKALVGKKPDTPPLRNNLYRECVQQAAPLIADNLVRFLGRFENIYTTRP